MPRACRIRSAALTLSLALAVASGASAQPRGTPRADAGREIAEKALRNGMRVIVWPDHDIPNVAMYTWYRVGSRNERPGITGLSHFFEHMMFNGSEKYPSGEFDRVTEGNGGADNAFTSEDVTCYQNWFPREILELIFKLESDRICCLSFDPKMVESERQVVYSERRTTVDDDNESLLAEQVQAAAYTAHPYHIPIIGWPSDIERWSIDDLTGYFRTYYAPNNATMIVVGDVAPSEVFALAEKYFEPIPAQPAPPAVTTREPPQLGERRVTLRKSAQTPLLQMAFHTGPADDSEAEARGILMNILVAGESSRLHRRLVEEDQAAVSVRGYVSPEGFDPGLVWFFVTVPPEKTVEATERALLDELSKIARAGVSAEEIQKARNTMLARYWRSMKTIDSKAEGIGIFEVLRGGYRRLFSAPERYNKVTLAQVQALARSLFDERNRTVGVLIPDTEPRAQAGPSEGGSAR